MKIDLDKYFEDYIGDISWYGESNHDSKSEENMFKARDVLYFLENEKEKIISELKEHQTYRTGNASAIGLHKIAKNLCKRFDENFDEESWKD